MLFGLCNVVVIFERLMENVLVGLNFEICFLYIDDIIVFLKDFYSYVNYLDVVL